MREIGDEEDLARLCRGSLLVRWAAQGLDGRCRAWASGDGRAVAVAAPALYRRDRLIGWGPVDAAAALVMRVLAEVGPSFRPLGAEAVIRAVVSELPALGAAETFGWMDTAGVSPRGWRSRQAGWLDPGETAEVEALLAASYPSSWAKPGLDGVERWAGVRDGGRLVAVGAQAWSAPAVGIVAGVAVAGEARGRGLGADVCTLLLADAVDRHGAAALMVDDWNHHALRIYLRLGLRYRTVAATSSVPRPD